MLVSRYFSNSSRISWQGKNLFTILYIEFQRIFMSSIKLTLTDKSRPRSSICSLRILDLCIVFIRNRKKYKNRNSDSIHSIFDSIRFGLLFKIHNSVRLDSTDSIFDSIRLIHNRISYFLFSVVLIMCACKNCCLFLPRAHSFLVLEFISHRIIIVPMKISTTKKRINTQILAEISFV